MTTHNDHSPVLVVEVIQALAPKNDAVYLDATFGRGGYTRAILAAADCRVIAIDRDPDAIAAARNDNSLDSERLVLVEGRFSDLAKILKQQNIKTVDGIAFDLGLSSPQLADPERGFSFRLDGPLDMRMERKGIDARQFVNHATEAEIASILYTLGEERESRRIARAIIRTRKTEPINTTGQLADIIRRAISSKKPARIDPATRSFQAIRIHINDELAEIERALPQAVDCLEPGGRLAVVSFHSLEDRIVKRFMQKAAGQEPRPSRHLPDIAAPTPTLRLITRKPSTPQESEINANPRARSARLRVAERTQTPSTAQQAINEVA